MDSTPAQTKASPAFIRTAPEAMCTDCIEDPQKRLTVAPATEIGSEPVSSPTMRATLNPCSPSGNAQPTMRSSTSSGSSPARSTTPRTTCAARSSGRSFTSAPLRAKVKGERP